MIPQKKLQKRRYPRRQKPGESLILCPHCNGKNCIKRGTSPHTGRQHYFCKDCKRAFTPIPAKLFEINPEEEYKKDIWDCRKLGIEPGAGKLAYTLKFEGISQPWLLKPAKEYIKLTLSTLSLSSARNKLSTLKVFSNFLEEEYPSIEPVQLDREVITNLFVYLTSKYPNATTRSHFLCDLRDFLDLCYQNAWLPVIRYLIRKEDYPKRPKAVPRFIPECVMEQLMAHIDDLAEPVMRMTLILIECGMRISELLYLKPDCLLQDKAGDWFLRYYQFKMKKEVTVPVSREIVRVIQEQRRYIQDNLDSSYEYLFCASLSGPSGFRPQPKPMIRESFARFLNKLAKTHNICDESGKLWHFQTHQFRHTVGTRMINNGVPQHIIQRYLGHESPEMTAVYAQIYDQTMKEEIAKFRGKVVNVSGQVVQANDVEADDTDLQWFKKSIQAQALPNGSCALPTISKGCPHANACLTCTHFRTSAEHLDTHKQELKQTQQLIEKAEVNGWVRQVEMNKKVETNLKSMIASLEAQNDETEA